LAFVVRPELERLAFGLRGKDLGGCDMDCIERANVNGERTLGLVDGAGVDSCKVDRHEQISQLLPLDSGFGIVKVSDETFARASCAAFNTSSWTETPLYTPGFRRPLRGKIPHSRRWRLTRLGRIAMSASVQLLDVQFPISHMKLAA
jgi:hypothetical protein